MGIAYLMVQSSATHIHTEIEILQETTILRVYQAAYIIYSTTLIGL